MVLATKCKNLEVVTSFLNNKKVKLKYSYFPWVHQRTEVSGQTTTMNPGEKGESRVTAAILLLEAEGAGAINW